MKPKIHTILALAAVAGLALAAGSANAAIIATPTSEIVNGSPHVGTTILATGGDLLETVGSVAGQSNTVATQHVTASLYDGKITTGTNNGANGGDPDAPNAAGYYGTGHFIEFDLDTTINLLGYDISAINIIQSGDSFRGGINVAVSLRQVGGSYTPLIAPPDAGTPGNVNMYAITNDSGPLIASGIDGVRFDFTNTATGSISGWTWYRELDVIGTAIPVPEPSAAALLGLGALAWVRRRRK
jgi:hypothetical protein